MDSAQDILHGTERQDGEIMNLENIKCFISLAECLNFTKAAEKEHITQTSMSRKIGSLEQELNVPLFYRDNRQVELTGAGKEFYVRAVKMMEYYDHTVSNIQNIHNGFTKELKIGVGIYEHKLLSPFLNRFVKEYPQTRISCMQFRYYPLLEQFRQNLLDVIFTSDQFLGELTEENIRKHLISNENWKVGIHGTSPLADLPSLSHDSLKDELLITMNEGSVSQILDYYRNSFTLRDATYVNSYETKIMMINAGLGVGFFPAFVDLENYRNIVLKSCSFSYRPRQFYIVFREDNPSQYVHRFVEEYCRFHQIPVSDS